MAESRKQALVGEIEALEQEGRRLASLPHEDLVPGRATAFTAAVAQQHVAVTAKRRELAGIVRREAGYLTARRD